MAVVVRSGAQVPAIARALALAEVPTRTAVGGARPARRPRGARACSRWSTSAIGRAALTAEVAAELLLGPFGGLDRLAPAPAAARAARRGARRRRQSRRATSCSSRRSPRPAASPRSTTASAGSAERLAATLAAVGAAAAAAARSRSCSGSPGSAAASRKPWLDQALGAGITAAEANRNLDGVVALFTAAKRFVERRPGRAGDRVPRRRARRRGAGRHPVPASRGRRRAGHDAVRRRSGLEFDIVVVAGAAGGRLAEPAPARLAARPAAARAGGDRARRRRRSTSARRCCDDELRMFALAVSRARSAGHARRRRQRRRGRAACSSRCCRRTRVAVDARTAAAALAARPHRAAAPGARRRAGARRASGRPRHPLWPGSRPSRCRAPTPRDWHGLLEPSTTEPLFAEDEHGAGVAVAARGVRGVAARLVPRLGLRHRSRATAMGLGTIMHWAMETRDRSERRRDLGGGRGALGRAASSRRRGSPSSRSGRRASSPAASPSTWPTSSATARRWSRPRAASSSRSAARR